MSRVVVVGSGFIGSHVVRQLRLRGEGAVAVDNRGGDADESGVPVVQLDLFDTERVTQLLASLAPDAIVLAAGAAPSAECYRPKDAWNVNVQGSVAVASAARRAGVPRLVYVSSFAVYGSSAVESIPEDSPIAPLTDYGRMKAVAENALQEVCSDMDLKIARACGLYGIAADAKRAGRWPRVLTAAVSHLAVDPNLVVRSSTFTGDEVLYVKDLAAALVEMATGEMRAETIFNVGAGHVMSASDLCDALRNVFPRARVTLEGPPDENPGRPPLDVRKVATTYGFRPQYALTDGLLDLVDELGEVAGANA